MKFVNEADYCNEKAPWVRELRKYLKRVDKLLDRLNEIDIDVGSKASEAFFKRLKPFELRVKDVRLVAGGKREMWVVEPQGYDDVTCLTAASEDIREDYFALQKMTDENARVTTGDGPGYGDEWYRATPDMLKSIRAFYNYLYHKARLPPITLSTSSSTPTTRPST